jgi:hypothetical protein
MDEFVVVDIFVGILVFRGEDGDPPKNRHVNEVTPFTYNDININQK